MDWLAKMHAAVDYIEAHLTEEIDLSLICQGAGCTPYQFQRVFPFVAGMSLAEYIEQRRLAAAVSQLQDGIKITDVAAKYRYASAAAFARAFQALYGAPPAAARRAGVKLKVYAPLVLPIPDKKEPEYRIETRQAFHVFGIETVASLRGEKGLLSPKKLWRLCRQNGAHQRLTEAAGSLPGLVPGDMNKVFGLENYRPTAGGTFSYMLCAFASGDGKTDGYQRAFVPTQTYAVFSSEKFPQNDDWFEIFTALQRRFYVEWLPTAAYQWADGPSLELYGGSREQSYIELWFPIQ